MSSEICDAISRRAVIAFDYDGGPRAVEPHCHGFSRQGKELLRGYQVSGYSQSGQSEGWKLFDLAKATGLYATGETFAFDRPQYNPDDPAMTVHCCV